MHLGMQHAHRAQEESHTVPWQEWWVDHIRYACAKTLEQGRVNGWWGLGRSGLVTDVVCRSRPGREDGGSPVQQVAMDDACKGHAKEHPHDQECQQAPGRCHLSHTGPSSMHSALCMHPLLPRIYQFDMFNISQV